LKDIRSQSIVRDREEMLGHLKGTSLEPRYSAGVWYFYPGASRFHDAYIDKGSIEDTLNKIAWMRDEGLIDGGFGVEAHYPNEVNMDNLHLYKALEKETGVRLITAIPFLFYDRRYEFGSLSNPDEAVWRHAIERTTEALRLNKELGTEFAVVWPGIDGYENPFGHDFYGMWNRFEKGLAEAMDEVPGVRVALEPKPYEPRGNNVYRNTANGLLMARDVEALLSAPQNKKTLSDGHALVGLNPEVGHVLMGHEELAYAFASVLREGRLMHSHWNSQPLGNYDQDLDVGVLGFDQMLAALLVFKMHGYAGYYGLDINLVRLPVDRALVLSMNALNWGAEVVNSLDYDALVEAMYDPAGNRGVVEDVLLRALSRGGSSLKPIP